MFSKENLFIKIVAVILSPFLGCIWVYAQDTKIKSGKIMAFRPLTLLENTNPKDLERFGKKQLTTTFKNQVPGVQSYIIKGERGDDKNKYVHLLIFDNLETRNFYFPWEHSGESNIPEAALKLWILEHGFYIRSELHCYLPGQIMLLDSLPKYVKMALCKKLQITRIIFL